MTFNELWVKLINKLFPDGYTVSPYITETDRLKQIRLKIDEVESDKKKYMSIYASLKPFGVESIATLNFQKEADYWVVSFRKK